MERTVQKKEHQQKPPVDLHVPSVQRMGCFLVAPRCTRPGNELVGDQSRKRSDLRRARANGCNDAAPSDAGVRQIELYFTRDILRPRSRREVPYGTAPQRRFIELGRGWSGR